MLSLPLDPDSSLSFSPSPLPESELEPESLFASSTLSCLGSLGLTGAGAAFRMLNGGGGGMEPGLERLVW